MDYAANDGALNSAAVTGEGTCMRCRRVGMWAELPAGVVMTAWQEARIGVSRKLKCGVLCRGDPAVSHLKVLLQQLLNPLALGLALIFQRLGPVRVLCVEKTKVVVLVL